MIIDFTKSWEKSQKRTKYFFLWNRWYAWYPIICNHKIMWLEYVMRKGYVNMDMHGYHYKEIK